MTDNPRIQAQFNGAGNISFLDEIDQKKNYLLSQHIIPLKGMRYGRSSEEFARITGLTIVEYAGGLLDRLENTLDDCSAEEALAVRDYLDVMTDAMAIYAVRMKLGDIVNSRDLCNIDKSVFPADKLECVELFEYFARTESLCSDQLKNEIVQSNCEAPKKLFSGKDNLHIGRDDNLLGDDALMENVPA